MKGINVITADQLKHWSVKRDTADGIKLARPEGRDGLCRRFKIAYLVFIGKYDALVWHKQ